MIWRVHFRPNSKEPRAHLLSGGRYACGTAMPSVNDVPLGTLPTPRCGLCRRRLAFLESGGERGYTRRRNEAIRSAVRRMEAAFAYGWALHLKKLASDVEGVTLQETAA